MDCYFCQEFDSERREDSRIIWEDDDFLLLPTVGCLTLGYCLLMPWEHVTSFAAISELEPAESFRIAELFRKRIAAEFGSTIIAEHGSGGYQNTGASCCEHAHLHLIPVPGKVKALCSIYEDVAGRPMVLSDISEIKDFVGQPYILLSPEEGIYWIWLRTEGFRRQFVRWVVARLIGIEQQYDWRAFTFDENMRLTKRRLERHFSDIS